MARVPRGRALCPGYRALRLLRRGHAVDVYDAWSEERGCRCIAKALRTDRLDDGEARLSLLLEARLLLGLSHPHLVRAYELVRRPRPILILETLTGATVSRLLTDHPRGFPARDVLFLGVHLASALGYLHARGYLHLDVKPSNVVAQGGTAKLIDLSLADRIGRRLPGVGTRGYMSPEQIEGRPLTTGTDVWGLGCLLYEAARGRRPLQSRLRERTTGRPNRLGGPSRLPRAAARIVDACLEANPERRPTLRELTETFRAAI
jgi:eukaryotic-like serine/threonine-protein kinase